MCTTEDQPIVALVGADVIDGTGRVIRNATVVLSEGTILEVGSRLEIPVGADIIDLTGKYIIPGLIDMHAHFFGYATDKIMSFVDTYPTLFLSGGVTTVRSPGEYDPHGVLQARDELAEGARVGCRIVCSGPYFDHAPSSVKWFDCISSPAEAQEKFEIWKDRIDFVKVYSNIQKAELSILVKLAREEGLKVAGHLGSITAMDAVKMGLNCVEHGVFHMPEFLDYGSRGEYYESIARIDIKGERMSRLIREMVSRKVAVIPTTVIFQLSGDFTDVDENWQRFLSEEAREQQHAVSAKFSPLSDCEKAKLNLAIERQLEFIRVYHEFGGKVFCGTDPTLPRLVPGKALHREMQQFEIAGLSPLEIIKIASFDSAIELGLGSLVGSVERGKAADLVVLDRNPALAISNLDSISQVYKGGVPYCPEKLAASMEGCLGR